MFHSDWAEASCPALEILIFICLSTLLVSFSFHPYPCFVNGFWTVDTYPHPFLCIFVCWNPFSEWKSILPDFPSPRVPTILSGIDQSSVAECTGELRGAKLPLYSTHNSNEFLTNMFGTNEKSTCDKSIHQLYNNVLKLVFKLVYYC